ncbi:MAG TPA: hypothetical protein VH593_33905 [Ktedonobacteraceae bacterium]|jgi:hypothetical protein
MYNLDFETMKQVMQEHQKTGLLYADVATGVTSIREPCFIEISLVAGTIVSCSLISKSGRRLTGEQAAKEIARLGQLRWNFTPKEGTAAQSMAPVFPQPVSPTPPSYPAEIALFPARTVNLDQWQVRSWPRTHRAVFALADGTKNIEKIAAMLSLPPATVYKACMDLQSIEVLIMGPQNRDNHYRDNHYF